jgi:CHAT domain-containing protein
VSHAFATRQKVAQADAAAVARALPSNTALLDFARVEIANFRTKGTEKRWLPANYLAFVLHAGQGDRVALIDLGEAETIDRLVTRFKTLVVSQSAADRHRALEVARILHEKLFVPLTGALGAAAELFLAPDGLLNLLPFEVLQGSDGRFLIEDYTISYLGSGRDLLGFGARPSAGGKALLLGDPDFDLTQDKKAATLGELALTQTTDATGAAHSSALRSLHFTRLPDTRQEVRTIQALLGADKADLFTDRKALEEVLRRKATPRLLHIATHGFFLSDQDLSALRDDDRGMRQQVLGAAPPAKAGTIENPLVRSGIALAGANRALAGSDLTQSDGIVTAEKILGLRLRRTDLVVLSACETGLGEVKNGEGVFGLRRAFTQAGAKSLVMSMWAVPDREPQELIVTFYTNLLSGAVTRAQALRQAALGQM